MLSYEKFTTILHHRQIKISILFFNAIYSNNLECIDTTNPEGLIMNRKLKHFRLALILLAIVLVLFQQWRLNLLSNIYKSNYSKELNWNILETELTFRKQVLRILDKPFMEIDKDISSQFSKNVDLNGFERWFKKYADDKPLIGGGFIWSRNDDGWVIIPISMNIDSSLISLLGQYLNIKYDHRYEDHPYPIWHRNYLDSTRRLINKDVGFTLYNEKYKPNELNLYGVYKGVDKIFGIIWNDDEYRKNFLSQQVEYIKTHSDEVSLLGLPFDCQETKYYGILITDAQGDTISHLGRVQLEPYLNMDYSTKGEKLRGWPITRIPKWRIFAQNHNQYNFTDYNRWRYGWGSDDALQGIRLILYDMAFSDKMNIIPAWIIFVVSLGFLFILILFQIIARERQRNFIAHVSHELRTPISKIKLFAETLRNDRTVSEAKEDEYLDNILHASDHLSVLVDNTLNLARLDAGKFKVTPTARDIGDWLESFYRSYKENLTSEGFKSELNIEPDLPKVSFDPEALELAFRNIIDNAVKYSEKQKEIEISARRKDDRMVILSVSDRGIGIPKKKCRAVFRRFYRIILTDREPVGGVGLGLSILKEIVTAHHGKVCCEEREGGGTSIKIELPLAQ
jgi:signal transduction histidine kinase